MASHSASISLYEASVPVYVRGLQTLDHLLVKATSHAEDKKMRNVDKIAATSLIADMHPLSFQITTATNTAKKAISRLLGDKELPSWEDDEKTIEELRARIAKAIKLLEEQTEAEFEEAAAKGKLVQFVNGGKKLELSAKEYLLGYGIPNFFFHVMTAYNILRANGVNVGKQDYLEPQLLSRAKVLE
jgi:uncharacterized protein